MLCTLPALESLMCIIRHAVTIRFAEWVDQKDAWTIWQVMKAINPLCHCSSSHTAVRGDTHRLSGGQLILVSAPESTPCYYLVLSFGARVVYSHLLGTTPWSRVIRLCWLRIKAYILIDLVESSAQAHDTRHLAVSKPTGSWARRSLPIPCFTVLLHVVNVL